MTDSARNISGTLRGFLTEGPEGTVQLAVVDGTWSIPAASATVEDWPEPTRSGEGRPVVVTVAPDTEVTFTKRYSVAAAGKPMTLTDEVVAVVGMDRVAELKKAWLVAPIWPEDMKVEPEETTSWEYTWLPTETTPFDGTAIDHD